MTGFDFGGCRIGAGMSTLVIAEIGINHEGDAEICGRLIKAAAEAGADAIKLQTIDADASYVPGTESHAVFSTAALSREETAASFAHARALGLEPFTTVGDFPTIDWVDTFDPAGYKISSGLLTALPIIRHAASKGRPLIISTGMAEAQEIDEAVATACTHKGAETCLMQCTSLYPAPAETLNLATIAWLGERYCVPAGFSDHSDGIEAAPLAVAAGAAMIEKHITLDRTRPGFDHAISLEPADFKRMVDGIRAAEVMLGVEGKPITPAERARAPLSRRHLVARVDIGTGEALDRDNIGLMRLLPGAEGLAASEYDRVLDRRARRALAAYQPITSDDLA